MKNTRLTYPTQINNLNDIELLIGYFQSILGYGFHPDTPFSDYINLETNEQTFTSTEAAIYDELLDNAFKICYGLSEDIYAIGMEILEDDPHDARKGYYTDKN